MIPFTRFMTVAMFAAICFVLIVPLAIQRHQMFIAIGVPVLFAIYLVANFVLWRRMKRRS
ncbi:MAG TPA: hypothetical protein VMF11_01015 [Candidatus Baltobacteraceae bacterium]|nr:hypothetical protein [Candidatus Baltobacteraceae bacterium]